MTRRAIRAGDYSVAITKDLPKKAILDMGLEQKWWGVFMKRLRCHSAIAGILDIEPGFLTDGASIPRVAWSILQSSDPDILYPSYFHDLLYARNGVVPQVGQPLTRKQCDEVLREQMRAVGAPEWKVNAVYAAVRMFGGKAWDQCSDHKFALLNDPAYRETVSRW